MRISTGARRALATFATAALIVSGTLASASAAHAAPAPATITRMAALGDSITQAAMTCSSLTSCPANSWATGTTSSVSSHYSRMRAAGASTLVGYNNAVSGALSSALNAQAAKAVTQQAQYVTIQIGANDACTSSSTNMTSTAAFKTNVEAALATLNANGSTREIFVASIPNLHRMFDLNRGSSSARFVWGLLRICQSMLANPTSTRDADVQRRLAVQARVDAYNVILADACKAATNCRFDGGAVAAEKFVKADISTRDYFHPSTAGQTKLANITWAQTQWVKP
jgi:lysophospholipase L1-like esterase